MAYGWDDPDPATVDEDTILARLLALNLERAGTHPALGLGATTGRGSSPARSWSLPRYATTVWPWQVGHVCQSYRYVRRPVANVPMTVPLPAQSGHAAGDGAGPSGARSIHPNAAINAA